MADQTELYTLLSLIRHAEQKILDVYTSDVMQCPVHLSIGQESVAVALCAHLRHDDLKIGTHRSHALYLANGGDLVAFFGELLGRACGCSRGYGGSMHMIDAAHGLVGTTSIVGGALPIAVGLGLSVRRPRVAAVLLGDAAADQGVFAESVNYAQLRKVPLVFVCENNRYSVYTPQCVRRAVHPAAVAKAFGMETHEFSIEVANDVFALYERLADPIARMRQGGGPVFIECSTVRRYDHNGVCDDIAAGFRDPAERELFDQFCPMKLARRQIPPDRADAIDAAVRACVEQAYAQALASQETVLEYSHASAGIDTTL
ncbi:MAG: thiamine pyrophosphate-dependent dehydrogenase E1 component subunit alpha [Phycisphaerae bacterium]|nr:thiamine pyrophosphate-dependent dehydrogenase E1 component subunit alpha [Phycisphaerae bacterium]